MSAQHTPGPWRVSDDAQILAGSDGLYVAYVVKMNMQARYAANAVLIAAAPDMLAALRAVVADWDWGLEDGDPYPEWLAPARAAIARAEGR